MLYKSIIRAAGIAAMFAVMFVGGAFAQRVGDVVQFQGQSYRVEESRNGRVVLQEVRGPSGGGGDRYNGGGHKGRRGIKYVVSDASLTWDGCKAEAERRGGNLAAITSDDEQKDIESLLVKGKYYWVGGYRDPDDVPYKWVTGERMNYTNWAGNYPQRGTRNRIILSPQYSWKWVDYANSTQYKYNCIFELDR